jgi:hypothetical protein
MQDRKVITFLEKEVVLVKAHGTKEVMASAKAGAKAVLAVEVKVRVVEGACPMAVVMVGGEKRVVALGSQTGVVAEARAVAVRVETTALVVAGGEKGLVGGEKGLVGGEKGLVAKARAAVVVLGSLTGVVRMAAVAVVGTAVAVAMATA